MRRVHATATAGSIRATADRRGMVMEKTVPERCGLQRLCTRMSQPLRRMISLVTQREARVVRMQVSARRVGEQPAANDSWGPSTLRSLRLTPRPGLRDVGHRANGTAWNDRCRESDQKS